MRQIIIKGAKENNLKNIDLAIPRNKVVCLVGVSGSGKSTVAFDIIAREGQRQYFESLSSLARRYLNKSNRPEVEEIKGISSSVIIGQDRVWPSPRSTVGTLTEIYTYLRLLYSRAGFPIYDSSYFSFNHPLGACPRCKGLGRAMDIDVDKLVDKDKSLNEGAILYSNWRVGSMYWKIIRSTGFFDMDKKVRDYSEKEFDRLMYAPKQRASQEEGPVMPMYQGIVTHLNSRGNSVSRYVNEEEKRYFNYVDCPLCRGGRLKGESLMVKINGKNIGQVANMPIDQALDFIKNVKHKNAAVIKPRLVEQLQFLVDAGVGYLSLNRSTNTLSGGEAQRVKLARQLGCDLVETIYVLDEPTAGLHPKDLGQVLKNLKKLRDNGNSVLVVEHDKKIIKSADHIVELGPGGGKRGGKIVFSGSLKEFLKSQTLTARYLKDGQGVEKNLERAPRGWLKIKKASRNNLKDINLKIPTGVLVALTGVSGAGKSSLVEEIVAQHPKKVVLVGQQPIGKNRRASIATYVGVFDEVRTLFAQANGMGVSRFSYNSRAGYCPECKGLGFIDMDMNFLGKVRTKCEKCFGKRYRSEVLDHKYQGRAINEILEMTAREADEFFGQESIKKGLQMLIDVGLDYVELGQSLDTLSGGESQRLKLASRLQSRGEFYILDEPTTGLHFADVEKLLKLLMRLVDRGNSVLVIEHNPELIRQADWIIDLGPGGGEEGGKVVAQGRVWDIKNCPVSWTGRFL
jgi:excinuclease UvrABC ATPase subunit